MTVTREPGHKAPNTIESDKLSNGYWVSTVRLLDMVKSLDSIIGIFPVDDRADLNTPGNYETMVFPIDKDGEVTDWTELDFRRYSTIQDAVKGHNEIVDDWMTKV